MGTMEAAEDHAGNQSSSTPIFSIGPEWFHEWRQQRAKDKFCKSVYNGLLSYTECIQAFNATAYFESWDPDPLDVFAKGAANDSNTTALAPDAGLQPVLPPFALWQTILIALCLALCIVLTVAGNTLVLVAFIVDRSIRQPSNYFIASLAATDMLIGTVSMPFYTVYVLMGYWDLGPLLCDLWLSVDYTVCLVSQYTVLLITVDRFCSVKIAARYRGWRTQRRVVWMVAGTWTVPALLFFTSIFGWEHFVGRRDLQPGECAVQFLKDPVFNTALIIGYYWTTLLVLFVLYAGIYQTAYEMQQKSEAKQRKMQSMVALSAGAMSGIGIGLQAGKPPADSATLRPRIVTSVIGSAPPAAPAPAETTGDHRLALIGAEGSANDKSERSSSPAFESDEDSAAPPGTRMRPAGGPAPKTSTVNNGSAIGVRSSCEPSPSFRSCIIPAPAQFRTSPGDSSPPSATCDLLVGLDGADLRFMDESSIAVQTPPISPPPPPSSSPPSPQRLLADDAIGCCSLLQSGDDAKLETAVTLAADHPVTAIVSATDSHSGHRPSGTAEVARSNSRRDFIKAFGSKLRKGEQRQTQVPVMDVVGTLGRQKSKSENRARKAFRTISFILGAFVICWTPYHVLALVEGFCATPPCTNSHLFMFCYFLCYANSPLNPFCYALANQQFKKTFVRILRGDLHLT